MKLTTEQQNKLVAKLNEVWKNKVCEICNQTNWMIDDTLFELREFHGGRTVLGSGAIKPIITISCNSCGNTKIMNAIQLGIVDPNNPEGETVEAVKVDEKKEGDSNE
jgi:RNase P subunit RPR2